MTDNLVAALARCQAKFPPIVKSHTNPAFKGSQYADVADVLAAVRPVLAAEGIVVSQFTEVGEEGGVILTTALRLGTDFLLSQFPLYVAGQTAQQVGSLLTYHRRYQLCAILGVHPVGDDDDGNLAATAARVMSHEAAERLVSDYEAKAFEAEDVARSREALQEAISGLTADEKELVRLELRNQKVPSLRKPGATRQQLDALADFLAGLKARAEPFDAKGPGMAATIAEGTRAAIEQPEFNPVVAGAVEESGTERARRAAIRRGE